MNSACERKWEDRSGDCTRVRLSESVEERRPRYSCLVAWNEVSPRTGENIKGHRRKRPKLVSGLLVGQKAEQGEGGKLILLYVRTPCRVGTPGKCGTYQL